MTKPFQSPLGFKSEKAAQISAYFASAWGGRIDKLALIKLVYIAERESVRLRGRPMIYDTCFSLKDGPICSSALDGMNGHIDKEAWAKYLQKSGPRDMFLVVGAAEYLSELSASDREVLDGVVDAHRGKTGSELRRWTHEAKNIPEYTEVKEKQHVLISYEDIAVGVGIKHPEDISEHVRRHRQFDKLFPDSENSERSTADSGS